MAGNTFGEAVRLTTFGESHGMALGGVLEGLPAGLTVDWADVQADVARRRPGQSRLTTPRQEADEVECLSGIFEGKTTGAPIGFVIRNSNAKPSDYDHIKDTFRPSHADYTYTIKYGFRDHRGGGRASARETVSRVVGGALARQWLRTMGVEVGAFVERAGDVAMAGGAGWFDRSIVDASPTRCPDPETAAAMTTAIEAARRAGDTLGGSVVCVARGVPAGWGEPVFDKLHAVLAHALFSLPAVKGVEFGSGFAGTFLSGSAHNDAFVPGLPGEVRTATNRSGGIQGGISNGEDIVLRVGFKPVATIRATQASVDSEGRPVEVVGKGRHDPCVLPRAVPLVEAMALLALADAAQRARMNRL